MSEYSRRLTKNLLKDNICKNCLHANLYDEKILKDAESNGHYHRKNNCGVTGMSISISDSCELFEKPEQEMTKDEFIQRLNGEWYK